VIRRQIQSMQPANRGQLYCPRKRSFTPPTELTGQCFYNKGSPHKLGASDNAASNSGHSAK
jgi:hypothetical protein